jgi:thioredoxin-like negative regulator of GroEL
MKQPVISMLAMFVLTASAFAGDNLKLNSKLDYTSDREDGPLITGDNMDAGVLTGRPAYVILYGEGCFNSKRQARRTVSLYEKYKGRVQFVIVDLDHPLSPAQKELKAKYYRGFIPHVLVLDASGSAVYNSSGEVDESVISGLLDKTLR